MQYAFASKSDVLIQISLKINLKLTQALNKTYHGKKSRGIDPTHEAILGH